MLTKYLFIAIAFFGVTSSQLVSQQAASPSLQPPTVTSGKDGIFAAFQTYAVAGARRHSWDGAGGGLFAELIRDLRFAKEVGNVSSSLAMPRSKKRLTATSLERTSLLATSPGVGKYGRLVPHRDRAGIYQFSLQKSGSSI